MRRTIFLAVVLAGVQTAAVVPAAASTGQIARAHADARLGEGSIAGRVDWTDCGERCLWIPYATVQPATPGYRCTGREIFDNDPNTTVVWNGGERTANGAAGFDLARVALAGTSRQVCLSVIDRQRLQDPICIEESPARNEDPSTCPLFDRYVERSLAGRLLTVRPTASPARPTTPPAAVRPAVLSLNAAKAAAKKALARKFGRKWRRGSRRRLSCRRLTATRRRCRASWRYAARRRRATVDVQRAGGRVRARVSR